MPQPITRLKFITPNVPLAWLEDTPTTIEALCAECSHPGMSQPLGNAISEFLNELALILRPNDQLFLFSSPSDTWERRAGKSGIATVRSGRVVRSITLRWD